VVCDFKPLYFAHLVLMLSILLTKKKLWWVSESFGFGPDLLEIQCFYRFFIFEIYIHPITIFLGWIDGFGQVNWVCQPFFFVRFVSLVRSTEFA
jgi:hypothetical protein